ncbi:hypothetical protein H5410_004043 [Solanum commersonii]|uniref:Uncharacterized protein n=1 Tax=Solanum commersonii TaxID=4109 RepID=A0A9J6B6I5_SOLCO|nr:hypothetical protein H5410_004043 [Solanum commersonii]
MKIEILVGKGRPTKPTQSAKLSNELGIITRNFLSLPNKFDIHLDEHYVKDSCEDILKNRSRQWR